MEKMKSILSSIKKIIFESMLDIHKQELHSTFIMVFYLIAKHCIGLILILIMFITSNNIIPSAAIDFFKIILFEQSQKGSKIYYFSFGLMASQFLTVILFFKIFSNKSSILSSKLLFVYMQLVQMFKYVLFIALGSSLQCAIQLNQFWILIVNIINLVFLFLTMIIFYKFNFTVNYKNKNMLSRFQSTSLQFVSGVTSILCLYFGFIGINSMTNFERLVFGSILLSLKVLEIKYNMFRYLYVDTKAFFLYGFFSIIQGIINLLSMIQICYSVSIIIQNFSLVLITITIFGFLAWKRYFQTAQQDTYFHEANDLKSQCQVSLYLKAMYMLTLESQIIDQNSIILSSLKKQHQIVCSNSHCYCQKSDNIELFIEDYIIHQLNSLRKIFSQNTSILLYQLSFRYNTFKKYPNILTRLSYLKLHQKFSLAQQFATFCLQDSLKLWIADRNIQNKVIESQTPLELQEINQKLQKIIKSDIQIKNKKWRYLSRGICRLQQIQQDTLKQLQTIKTVQKIYKQFINKFRRSVSFNVLLIFYTKKIAFINQNFQDLNKNIAESLRKIKDQQISNDKQFRKFIFNKRSCVIQSFIDENNMGNITKTSKNIHDLFGYQQNKIIGSSINKLMPNFMAIQHVIILDDWVKTGTWRTIGKLKQIFCCHKDQYCFSALIYLKMYVRNEGLFFVTTIFKKNQSDFLILNRISEIQGVGRKWYKILGQNCKKLPIEILIQNFAELNEKAGLEFQAVKLKVNSLNNNHSFTDEYLQQMHTARTQQQKQTLIKCFKQKLAASNQIQKWQINFQYKKYQMRNINFMVFQLTNATLIQETESSNMLTQNFDFNNARARHTTLIGSGKLCNQSQPDNQSQESFESNHTNHEEELNNAFQDKGTSSMASFGERQNFTLSKLLKTFYEFLIAPQKIHDKRIQLFNLASIIFTFILIGIVVGSFLIYTRGLSQIQEYINANAQINMNMQMTTLIYDRFISLNQYNNNNNDVQFQSMMNSSYIDLAEFHSRITSNYDSIIRSISSLSSTNIYDYLTKPVLWKNNANSQTEIEVIQFLTYYSYFIREILSGISASNSNCMSPQKDLYFYIERIQQNFPTLKKLNYNFSQSFVALTKMTYDRLNLTLYMSICAFLLVALGYSMMTNHYDYFRYQQKYKNLDVYKSLSGAIIQKIKQYYNVYYRQLIQSSSSANRQNQIQKNFDLLNNNEVGELQIGINYANINKNRLNFLGKQRYYQWIYGLILLLILNSVNTFMSVQIKTFIDPLTELMDQINQIMDAQNKILQSYLDLKGNYLLSPPQKYPNQAYNAALYSSLQTLMDQNQVTFNKMVTFKSSFLQKFDSNFYVDFNALLIENICQTIKGQIIEAEYQKCLTLAQSNQILDDGVITYMNHFQRKLRKAIIQISSNYSKIKSSQGRNYFINNNFSVIDLSMSFNIKIFKCLVDRILGSYRLGIAQMNKINIIVLILLSIPQFLRIVFWLQTVQKQKRKLAMLYGYLLLIPVKTLKQVKNLAKDFQKNMQYIQNT